MKQYPLPTAEEMKHIREASIEDLRRQLRLAEMSNNALRNQVKTLKEQRTKNRRTIKKANDRIAGLVARLEAHGIPSKLSQNAELE